MPGPSVRNLALGELTPSRVHEMVREGETLFFEHKKDMTKGVGFQIAKAAASFANTLGGWLFIGVVNNQIRADWQPPPGGFVDAVRQRMEDNVDPMPSFAATVMEVEGRQLGIVRVYESADTPHILSDGSVVVREPAQDSRLRKLGVYEPTPVRSHYELLQLAQRGREARRAAGTRFDEGLLPLADAMLEIKWTTAARAGLTFRTVHADSPALIIRLAPLTITERWADWAVGEVATHQLTDAVAGFLDGPVRAEDAQPFARGFAVAATETRLREWTPGASRSVTRRAVAVADAGGLVGMRLAFQLHEGSGRVHYQRPLAIDEIAGSLQAVLARLARVMFDAEHIGRFVAHGYWMRIGDLYRVVPQRPEEGQHPAVIPFGGEVTVASAAEDTEHAALCRRWAEEVLRSCGVSVWGTGTTAPTE